MPDSAVTPNVFLDTEVFDAHQLDFDSPNLRRLVRLAAEGTVNLLLTTVTKSEVAAHLDEKAREAFKQIREFRRSARIMRKLIPAPAADAVEGVDLDGACKTLRGELDKFIADTIATVLPVDEVSPEAIFKKYFEGKAPFGEGNKKSEFPDAFACAAIERWSAGNRSSQIYVVSNDADWRRACVANPALISIARIDELLQLFADSVLVTAMKHVVEEKRGELTKLIEQKAYDLCYYAGDQLVDGEVDQVERVDAQIEDIHVVEVKDGVAALSLDCTLNVDAFVVAEDADSGIYDHETKSMHYVYRSSGTVTRELELAVEVRLTYDQAHPERVEISGIGFEEDSVDLDVGESELTRDDDELGTNFGPPDA